MATMKMNRKGTETTMNCKHCGGEVEQGTSFCKNCGAPAISFCTKCGTSIPATPGMKYCPECQTKIADMSTGIPSKESVAPEPGSMGNLNAIRIPEWYPVKSVNSTNWAIAIYPVLCVLIFFFYFFHSMPAILIYGIAVGFSLLGLFKKQSWGFLVAAIIHGLGIALSPFAAALAVIGFFAFKQSRQNKNIDSDDKD